MEQDPDPNGQVTYQIQVEGKLDEGWSGWFKDMTVTFERGSEGSPITTLTGPVADQAALRGILNRIWDLHLTVLSVTRGGVR